MSIVTCEKCGENFDMGRTGTVDGCDNCTGTKRDADGYIVPGPGELMVYSSIQVRCLCGEKHWLRTPHTNGKFEVTCACGVVLSLEELESGDVMPWAAIEEDSLEERIAAGKPVLFPTPEGVDKGWRCEVCGHLYEEPFSDEMCKCVKEMAKT